MARSRYENSSLQRGQFLFKIDNITKKKKNLIFYNSLKLKALSEESLEEFDIEQINFAETDTLMGLSQKFYDDPSYWWVIALLNDVGSEADIAVGQELTILLPITALLPELEL